MTSRPDRSSDGDTPRISLRQAHKELTRKRIVNAARQCFYAKGYAVTSMDEIAAAAGVQRTTMYAHFGSKNALLLHLFAGNVDHVVAVYGALLDAPVIDRAVLRDWLNAYIRSIGEYHAATRLFYLAIATDDTVEQLLEGQRAKVIEMFGTRFPAFDVEAGPDRERKMIKAQLFLMRINQFVGAAARTTPVFTLSIATDIIVDEMMEMLAPAKDHGAG